MYDPCVIVIERKTRETLKEVAKKSETYTDIINELISLKNQELFKKVRGTNPQPQDMPANIFYPKGKEAKINSHESMQDCNR